MAEKLSRRDLLKRTGELAAAVGLGMLGWGCRKPPIESEPPLSERLLTDANLQKEQIKTEGFPFQWETEGKLTPEEQKGKLMPRVEILKDENDRTVGYKITLHPVNFLGSHGVYIMVRKPETPIAGRVVGQEWLSLHLDPKIESTQSASEQPPLPPFYVLDKYLSSRRGWQERSNVIPIVSPEQATSIALNFFAGVYERGKYGAPYFDRQTIKVYTAGLPSVKHPPQHPPTPTPQG